SAIRISVLPGTSSGLACRRSITMQSIRPLCICHSGQLPLKEEGLHVGALLSWLIESADQLPAVLPRLIEIVPCRRATAQSGIGIFGSWIHGALPLAVDKSYPVKLQGT